MSVVRKDGVATGSDLEFVLSDATVDRYGDIVEPAGWDLQRFRQNPVALWDHGKDPTIGRKPIGRWEDVRVERGKLLGRLVPVPPGPDQAVNGVVTSLQSGFLRAVSVGFLPKVPPEPIDKNNPYGGQRFKKQELLETSLVAVPANPAAILQAKSLNISDETISRIFGGQAENKHRAMASNPGGNAVNPPVTGRSSKMSTLAQRIMDAQNELVAKKDRLTELTAAEDIDEVAVVELTGQIDAEEKRLTVLQAAEAKIGADAQRSAGAGAGAPTVLRRPLGFPQPEIKASDLIVRAALCQFVSKVTGKPIERVLEDRYPGHEATAAVVTKADATIATTSTSGWASQLVQTATADFLDQLSPFSIYPGLAAKGIKVTFNNNQGSVTIPSSSSDTALAGGFVLEGDPIPVGRMTVGSVSISPRKFGIITTMSKEAAMYTTPALESVLRRSILRRTAITLDGLLLDTTAESTTRPAGLLHGVSAAATAFGGGDYQAVIEDINALMAPFDTANAGRSMVLIMHPQQARRLAMMPGPDGTFGWADRFMSEFTVLTSTNATARRIIAVDAEDFASGSGDVPQFDVSEQAVLHMSDAPGEIVTASGTVNDPIRSMFQTNSLALRMILPMTWKMRRSGMVQYIDSTTW